MKLQKPICNLGKQEQHIATKNVAPAKLNLNRGAYICNHNLSVLFMIIDIVKVPDIEVSSKKVEYLYCKQIGKVGSGRTKFIRKEAVKDWINYK